MASSGGARELGESSRSSAFARGSWANRRRGSASARGSWAKGWRRSVFARASWAKGWRAGGEGRGGWANRRRRSLGVDLGCRCIGDPPRGTLLWKASPGQAERAGLQFRCGGGAASMCPKMSRRKGRHSAQAKDGGSLLEKSKGSKNVVHRDLHKRVTRLWDSWQRLSRRGASERRACGKLLAPRGWARY